MVHLVLLDLIEQHKIEKLGRSPKTVYRLITSNSPKPLEQLQLNQHESDYLKMNFLLVDPAGNLIEGAEAFNVWCSQRKLPVSKTLQEFIQTQKNMNHITELMGLSMQWINLKAPKASLRYIWTIFSILIFMQ